MSLLSLSGVLDRLATNPRGFWKSAVAMVRCVSVS